MGFDPIQLLALFVALLLALTLHEFAHAWVSNYLGDDTARSQGRLTINPLAHIDPVLTLALPIITFFTTGIAIGAARPVPFNPWAVRGGRFGAALVALAGPLTNLIIAMFFAIWLKLMPVSVLGYEVLGTIIVVNLALFVFNLIPFPPLDGSRVLYAVAPAGLREGMDRIERAGMGAILIFFLALYMFGLDRIIAVAVRSLYSLLVPGGPLP